MDLVNIEQWRSQTSTMTTTKQTLYKTDFDLWLAQTVSQLQQHRFAELDIPNLIEELETLGKSDKLALESNLRILLMHLLKWRYQPSHRTGSWLGSIKEHRRRVNKQLNLSPSLNNYLLTVWDECYQDARDLAATETELPLEHFPEPPPFSVEQALTTDFLPE